MNQLLDRYCGLLKVVMTLLMVLMLSAVSIQILSRLTGLVPRYIWTEEVARFCFVWIIMVGAMVAVREGTHFAVDLLPAAKSRREEGVGKLMVHLGMLLMAIVFAWYRFQFARFGWMQHSEMRGINMLSIYISFPIAGVTWVVFLIEKLLEDYRMIAASPTETQE